MLVLQMILECATPLHCGSGEVDPILDQPIARDAWGIWRIPGSSLAGALRALCASLDKKLNKNLAPQLFGEQIANESSASLVWCPDALLLDYDHQPAAFKKQGGEEVQIPLEPFIRDHVKLDLERDSAADGGKFDAEIVPAGARFLAEFRLDAWDCQKSPLTDEQKACFDELCAHVLAGNLELGGQTSNGYGRYKVIDHSYRELDLLKPEDMQIWLNTGYGDLPEKDVAHARKLPEPVPLDGEKRLYGDISLPLVCDEPILIGGGSPMPGDGREADADILFALSPWLNYEAKELQWRWAIPGSSLKGVFRHAVYNILRDLGLSEYDAKEHLKNLFGHEKDGGQCGKLRFEDCLLADNHPGAIIQHVSIDRFTGGAVKGALFNEEPLWQPGLKLRPRLHVAGADAKEAALVFHALLDLSAGLLSVGNGANRGNGRLAAPVGTPPLNLLAGDLRWKGSPILGEQNSANFEKALEDWDLELMEEMNL